MDDPRDGAGTPPSDRTLGDGEVQDILALAARRDATMPIPGEQSTVGDLMAAAAEVGLDPGEVRRAALVQRPHAPAAATRVLLGAPDTRTVQAFLPGAALPADRPALVRVIEASLGRHGTVETPADGRLIWKEDHTIGRTRVELQATDGGTALTVEADRAGHYASLWSLGFLGWAAALWAVPALAGWMSPGLAGLAFLAVPFLAARPFWTRSDRALVTRLEDATLALLRHLEESAPSDPAPPTLEPGPNPEG